MYDPFADAARLGAVIVERPLDGLLGECDGAVEIVLNPNQSERQKLCTCAHEVVHLERGDAPFPLGYPDAARQSIQRERYADEIAARRLIGLRSLAAVLAWAPNEYTVADELGVDVPTVVTRIGTLTDAEKDYIECRQRAVERGVA
jgi:hypothetical protein